MPVRRLLPSLSRLAPAVLAAGGAALALCGAAGAAGVPLPGAGVSATKFVPTAAYQGIQHLHYEYGPIAIHPGQNTIDIGANKLMPQVPGYITRFKPGLVYSKDHTTPRVDVIHLHHGVWLINGYPTFAAGEEKTILNFPQGYGLHSQPTDTWLMNYMIHNLTPNPSSVYITYDIDFVPDAVPAAQTITPVHPLWMDVAGIKAYPVFDAIKGSGHNGKYTFPDDAKGAAVKDIGAAHQWTAPSDITLISAAGHMHPGGLRDDLKDTRAGTTKEIFRSEAKYFEPAGAVSWDVATTSSPPTWKVAVKKGDTLNVSTTYDVSKASWYESMGIMVEFYADGIVSGAQDPFTQKVDWHGLLTHGHLPENDNHGGSSAGLPNAETLLNGPAVSTVDIKDFLYGQGDLNLNGGDGRPPVVRAGQSLTFTNLDALPGESPEDSIYHTITACKDPCNKSTGIAYPLANGKVSFDSGELGYGPSVAGQKFTPAANRNTWKTPKNLAPGTYSYFCRIHPFMRGSFRVIAAKKSTKKASKKT